MSILVLTSDTLIGTPATGNLEYNGQFFGTDSNASRAQLQRITLGTAVSPTTSTTINYTGLPAWVKKITVIFSVINTNGSSPIQIQLGTVSGFETTGYTGCCSVDNSTTGFRVVQAAQISSATTQSGSVIINNLTGNTWTEFGVLNRSDGTAGNSISGFAKTLSGTLTQLRITTVNGTDLLRAGSVNILIEG